MMIKTIELPEIDHQPSNESRWERERERKLKDHMDEASKMKTNWTVEVIKIETLSFSQ